MILKGSRTEDVLRKALSRELHAYFNYLSFGNAARKAGMEQIAQIFFQIAKNEMEHAEQELAFIGSVDDVKENLRAAISAEYSEATKYYPEAAEIAEKEGFTEIAAFFRKMSKVEKKHGVQLAEFADALDAGAELQGRTVGHSEVNMAQWMLPDQANPAGYIHGGELMKLMDNAAYIVGVRHCNSNVVTAMVDDLHFLKPVRVGDLALIHGKVVFISHSSIRVKVEIEHEDPIAGTKEKALTAYYIMVALDPEGKPMEVPPLVIFTEEEQELYNEALQKYQARKEVFKK